MLRRFQLLCFGYCGSLQLLRSIHMDHSSSTSLSLQMVRDFLASRGFSDTVVAFDNESLKKLDVLESKDEHIETKIVAYNACANDPYGASSMPIYQTATFAQPGATEFGDYDYTRSGNPTRDALQKQIAGLDGGARAFCFTTGMAALSAVTRLAQSGDEVIGKWK
jgi:hypothetical protein